MRNTRADVVAAALRVLDEHGLEFCSMRRVAGELGVQPSALYHHVQDKQSLLALMADEIVAGVVGGGAGASGNGSAAQLGAVAGAERRGNGAGAAAEDPASLCRSLRQALLAVRDGADVVATASAFRLGASAVEQRLAAMVGADGARTLLLYTFGQAQATQTQLQAHAFAALAAGRPANAAADPIAASRAELAASFDRGLEIVLAGVAAGAAATSNALPAR